MDAGLEQLTQTIQQESAAILRFCKRSLRNPDDAQDAAQEAYLKATRFLRTRPDFVVENYKAWLWKIVHNSVIDMKRANGRKSDRWVNIDDHPTIPDAQDCAVDAQRQIIAETIANLIHTNLTPDQRDSILLYHFAGYSCPEIITMMFPTPTPKKGGSSRINTLIFRAKCKLREVLSQEEYAEMVMV